ncbi:radial spoke head 10 homolog B [Solea solea]|uniref:radial spoke head 10 homolog B n=1 Tax=Solea solea TaxID=90069 RepID=UPI00272B7D08|nr:radial spoke head 10 homolog B [Solea solea]
MSEAEEDGDDNPSINGFAENSAENVKNSQSKRKRRRVRDDEECHLPTLMRLTIESHEGETLKDLYHGEGEACFEGDHTYKGTFTKGVMHGRGIFTWADGMKYEGDFVNNLPSGYGTITWPSGSSYTGEIYKAIRHGIGTYQCADNGVKYTGQWNYSKRHGQGVMYFNEDKTSWYKGDWEKNNRVGYGVRRYPSGNVYFGEWKDNLKHGEGSMKWLNLGQEYVGTWQDGIQHGKGTHVWILRRTDISQYCRSNRYTGDFVQGQRHGQGTFFYAGGATYEGEWRSNKKHGKGKFTFKDGHVVEGEFKDDQMITPDVFGNRSLTPLCGVCLLSGSAPSSILGPDLALNIDSLLDLFPEKRRNIERKQVEFALLRNNAELRSIYSFYSRLGSAGSLDNIYLLSRLQLWRLLKDCYLHHHHVTLTQINHFIKGHTTTTESLSPFSSIPLCGLLSCLVIVAYHIYSQDMQSQRYVLAACVTKLLAGDILPHAKNVKGFLFGQSGLSAVAMIYIQRSWEAYRMFCRVHSAPTDDEEEEEEEEKSMTYRQLLWMFKDLHLLDNKLTSVWLMKFITAESLDPSDMACLKMEISFLEFYEVLLCCAEVKCQRKKRLLSRSDSETRDQSKERKPSNSPRVPRTTVVGKSRRNVRTQVRRRSQSAEDNEEQERAPDAKVQALHEFFNQVFFPAVDHYQSITAFMEEEKVTRERKSSSGPQ